MVEQVIRNWGLIAVRGALAIVFGALRCSSQVSRS